MTINRCPDPLNFSYLPKKVKTISKGVSLSCGELFSRTGFNQPYHGEISVQFMQGFPIPSTLLRCSSCQQPRWVCRRPAWRPCRPAVGSSGLPWKVGIEIFFQNVVTGVRWQISALNVVCKGDFASISRNMTVCSEEVHLLSFVGRCV